MSETTINGTQVEIDDTQEMDDGELTRQVLWEANQENPNMDHIFSMYILATADEDEQLKVLGYKADLRNMVGSLARDNFGNETGKYEMKITYNKLK